MVEFSSETVTLSVTISVSHDVELSWHMTGWDVSQLSLILGTSSDFDFFDHGPTLSSDWLFLLTNVVIFWELTAFVFCGFPG